MQCVGKMKDNTGDVAKEEFVGLKPKMYSFLIDDNREHKKAKEVNKNAAEQITQTDQSMFCWIRNAWDIPW